MKVQDAETPPAHPKPRHKRGFELSQNVRPSGNPCGRWMTLGGDPANVADSACTIATGRVGGTFGLNATRASATCVNQATWTRQANPRSYSCNSLLHDCPWNDQRVFHIKSLPQ